MSLCSAPCGFCLLFLIQTLGRLHILHASSPPHPPRLQRSSKQLWNDSPIMSSPQGRWTSSREPRLICFQRRARTFSPDFLNHFWLLERGWAAGRGSGRELSGVGCCRRGVGEWPDQSPDGRPETRWECPSRKPAPHPERGAGPGLASSTTVACPWCRPQSCPRVLTPRPALSLARSVLSSSGLELDPWGRGDGTDPTLPSAAPFGARTCCLHSLSSPLGLGSELALHSLLLPEFSGCVDPVPPWSWWGSVFPLVNSPKENS